MSMGEMISETAWRLVWFFAIPIAGIDRSGFDFAGASRLQSAPICMLEKVALLVITHANDRLDSTTSGNCVLGFGPGGSCCRSRCTMMRYCESAWKVSAE